VEWLRVVRECGCGCVCVWGGGYNSQLFDLLHQITRPPRLARFPPLVLCIITPCSQEQTFS
jgi:hypothetical protein